MAGWMPVVVLVSISLATCKSELYTALVDLEELLESEAALLHTLEDYITAQENKLQLIKKVLHGHRMSAENIGTFVENHYLFSRKYIEFTSEHEDASKDVNFYLSNPLNAFLLVKRLTVDWKDVESTIKNDLSQEALQNMTLLRDSLKFPTEEDLTGAAVALMRLQDTYQLQTSSLARGELNGVQYSTQLTAADCFELGRQSYNHQDFYHTVLWMTEALVRQEQERNMTKVERWEILEYLAYSTYMQGNVRNALQLTDELLTIVPSHQRALGNKKFYQTAIDQDATPLNIQEKRNVDDKPLDELPERDVYEMLCRDAVRPPPSISAKLKCRYVHHNRPFLRIAPLKEEEAYLDPRILLYRDALYESEMETFKRMAQPRLRRATVQNYKTGDLEVAHYRISKSAWLKEQEHEAVARVSRRIEDMTGLTTSTAEELQVVNYGIGGHYEPHYDFARREEKNAFKSLGTGNRIATVLFYMSVVEQGGATVFPELRLSLWPEKGTAAFWMNLYPHGEGDLRTRHAACPVLAGSKWVSNKWLHERGQEFMRPCVPRDNMEDDEER